MQAIIMAAGKGTRLGSLTKEIPKPLIPIKGVPLLKRQIDNLLKIPEISEIIIVTGYKADMINDYVKENFDTRKIRIVYNEDYDKGAVVSVSKAEPYIKDEFGFLVMNADHLFSSSFYRKVIFKTKHVVVCFFQNRPAYDDERRVKIHSNGDVELSKGIKDYQYGYTGLIAVSGECKEQYFKCLNKVNKDSHPDEVILPLSKKVPIQLFDIGEGIFLEVDTPEDYENAQKNIGMLLLEDL